MYFIYQYSWKIIRKDWLTWLRWELGQPPEAKEAEICNTEGFWETHCFHKVVSLSPLKEEMLTRSKSNSMTLLKNMKCNHLLWVKICVLGIHFAFFSLHYLIFLWTTLFWRRLNSGSLDGVLGSQHTAVEAIPYRSLNFDMIIHAC